MEAVDRALQERSTVLQSAHDRLLQAQQRMKLTYDASHREVCFEVGDWVWLKLHPYRQLSIAKRSSNKLSPKYFGPFKVLDKIETVAYRLDLPVESRIHNVFHVSLLKKFKGTVPDCIVPLPSIRDGHFTPIPHSILRTRLNRGRRELSVCWEGGAAEDATWEDLEILQEAYPELELEDKLHVEEGSNVEDAFVGKVYSRRKKSG